MILCILNTDFFYELSSPNLFIFEVSLVNFSSVDYEWGSESK